MPNRSSSAIWTFRRGAGSSAAALAGLAAGLALGGARGLPGAGEVTRATAGALGAQDPVANQAGGGTLQALGVLAERAADLLEAQARVRGDEGLQVAGGLHAGGRGLATAAAGGPRRGDRACGARAARGRVALDRLAQRVERGLERRLAHAPADLAHEGFDEGAQLALDVLILG